MSKLIQIFQSKPIGLHDPVWFFDLDNTLHDASHAIFKIIDQSMTQAVMQSLQVDATQADYLRKKYWRQYGATMIGLHKHHGINPADFLSFSHDFDVRKLVKKERNLAVVLNTLTGNKYVLTNSPSEYAVKVLDALSIRQCFNGICAIDHMILHGRHKPKPSIMLLQLLQAHLGAKSLQCILVEDTIKNLKSAKQLGWKTILVHNPGTPFSRDHVIRPAYLDLRIKHIKQLLTSNFCTTVRS